MIIPYTVREENFKILLEHFNNENSMVVTDFDACVYDFWNIRHFLNIFCAEGPDMRFVGRQTQLVDSPGYLTALVITTAFSTFYVFFVTF